MLLTSYAKDVPSWDFYWNFLWLDGSVSKELKWWSLLRQNKAACCWSRDVGIPDPTKDCQPDIHGFLTSHTPNNIRIGKRDPTELKRMNERDRTLTLLLLHDWQTLRQGLQIGDKAPRSGPNFDVNFRPPRFFLQFISISEIIHTRCQISLFIIQPSANRYLQHILYQVREVMESLRKSLMSLFVFRNFSNTNLTQNMIPCKKRMSIIDCIIFDLSP